MGFLIFLIITAAAVPFGAQFLRLLRISPAAIPERFLASATVGYVLIGYATLALGLVGKLTPWGVALMLAGAGLLGLGNWDLLWEAGLQLTNVLLRGLRVKVIGARKAPGDVSGTPEEGEPRSSNHVPALLVVVPMLILTLILALEPPSGRDFDGLSEHLAQAAFYARHHVVEPLWHDHHSQFPSNMQMLYTLGLSFGSVSAAKLFEWFHGVLALVAAALIARRFMARGATAWAAVVLATTPMFMWLMGVSYVDLGVVAYGLVALLALLEWERDRQPEQLLLAALVAGCAGTVKMQGLTIFAVLGLGALVIMLRSWRERSVSGDPSHTTSKPSWGTLAAAAAIGLLICAPWYVKSAVYTGNPVYPFAYGIFGGKHWTANQAVGYSRHQLEFGLGELPPQDVLDRMPRWKKVFVGPREPWKWLFAPFGVTYMPWEYEVNLGQLPNLLMTSVGPLYLALLGALILIRGKPRALTLSLWLFLPLWIWWFLSMQLERYLLPSLVLTVPAAGYAAYRGLHSGPVGRQLFKWALGLWSMTAILITLWIAAPAVPVVLGIESRDDYLTRSLDVYAPSKFIREHTPPEARVATYGEVRTFYFDRDAFWAESGHSDLIPYQQMKGPEDLLKRYRELGITHVLVNVRYLPGFWEDPEQTLGLLRQAMDRRMLVLMGSFGPRQNYLLFEVRQPGGRT
ncbi:MAG: phospholipid carrier-dependent glycosyltransferase [Armatimonadia bacterium]